jgi:hypothetical protein
MKSRLDILEEKNCRNRDHKELKEFEKDKGGSEEILLF